MSVQISSTCPCLSIMLVVYLLNTAKCIAQLQIDSNYFEKLSHKKEIERYLFISPLLCTWHIHEPFQISENSQLDELI